MANVEVEWTELLRLRVDSGRRLIYGLVVPWGKRSMPESVTGNEFMFSGPERLNLPEDPTSIPLVDGHDANTVGPKVGHAIRFEVRPDGLHGAFRVDEGPDGDEILRRADGHALSIGVRAHAECDCGGDDEPCACDVIAAEMDHVALVDIGAFREARVYDVAAKVHPYATERDGEEEGSMGNEEVNKPDQDKSGENVTTLDSPDAAIAKFREELDTRFSAMADKLEETQERQAEALAKVVSDAFGAAFQHLEGPDTQYRGELAAARIKVTREEPVYRFDGNVRAPSLVRDFAAAQNERDQDAIERLRKFQAQQKDLVDLLTKFPPSVRTLFAVTTDPGSGGAVVPPGYRPDLFVNELSQGRPIVAQASRGTITDATPFTVPRFVSSSNLANEHTEGSNPAPGNITLDQTTVSPKPVSGRLELTREIVDASNPAIDAIALAAMRESYNQQTEARAYEALNGVATGTLVEQTTATELSSVADIAVADKLRTLLARYPFARFASPTGAVMGQAATVYMARVRDSDGRALFPSVGASNSSGIGNAVDQQWSVDGLSFVPAWSVVGDDLDDVVLILNRQDFWVWESPLLTFRFEEKSGPALVELALFAYFGCHVLRPAGIAALRRNDAGA